ncbi:MAG: RNA 3'-terminal phosphate cyclase [Candidatus Aenigmarchaeota archaeon]|nr:RNA 3'-terminal phosphate cyclase [Candidatus Aenigmarchaeota archaeon]
MIEIPGDHLEGGGQIIRTSCALSAVTGKAVKITNIRKGRPNPGLQAQHIAAIEALSKLCDAKVTGLKQGNTELVFEPGDIRGGNIAINIPTAGSVGLVLQGLMIATGDIVNIHINGGATNGKWAAPALYIKNVLLPLLSKMDYKADIFVDKFGYYPKGGAKIRMEIEPTKLKPIIMEERGKLISIQGTSHASVLLKEKKVAERQAKSAESFLRGKIDCNIICIEPMYVETENPGSALDLQAVYENTILGADALGEIRKKAEDVGKESAQQLLKQINSDGAVDEHAEDQLLPYMALACENGESKIRVGHLTKHTETNIWTIEQFLPVKFEIENKKIRCHHTT